MGGIIESISENVVLWCSKRNEVELGEEETIRLGIQLFIEGSSKVLMIIIIGLLLGEGVEVLVSLVCFCSIRRYAGGIHLETNIGCFAVMCMLILSSVQISKITLYSQIDLLIILIVCVMILIKWSLNEGKHRYIEADMSIKNKSRALIVLGVIFLIAVYEERYRAVLINSAGSEILTILPWKLIMKKKEGE